ncbi:MAG: hypothetical protein MK165_02150 [Pirellulaceae bacterium]|nr:hypothetical protein [Pirellulaceae bacterium]
MSNSSTPQQPALVPEDSEVFEQHNDMIPSVFCVLLGLFSVLGLANQLFITLPVLALLLGGFTLWRDAQTNRRTNKSILAGMTLAMLFGSCATTAYVHRITYLQRQSRIVEREWFDLLQDGKYFEAFLLTEPPSNRTPHGTMEGKRVAGGHQQNQKANAFKGTTPIPEIIDYGNPETIKFVRSSGVLEGKMQKIHISSEYVLAYEEQGRTVELPFLMTTTRKTNFGKSKAEWWLNLPKTEADRKPPPKR